MTVEEFVYDPLAPGFQENLVSIYCTRRDHFAVYHRKTGGWGETLPRFDNVVHAVHDVATFCNLAAVGSDVRFAHRKGGSNEPTGPHG